MLVDGDYPYPGQPIRAGCGDQLRGGLHRDRIHGVPRNPQFSGDLRDSGAVDHQPPQHITRTPTQRCGPRRGELAEILIECNPARTQV